MSRMDNINPNPFGPGFFESLGALSNTNQRNAAARERQMVRRQQREQQLEAERARQNEVSRAMSELNQTYYRGDSSIGFPESPEAAQSRAREMDNIAGMHLDSGNRLPNLIPGVTGRSNSSVSAELAEAEATKTVTEALLLNQARTGKRMDDLVRSMQESEGFMPELTAILLGGAQFQNQERIGQLLMDDTIAKQLTLNGVNSILDDASVIGSTRTQLGTRASQVFDQVGDILRGRSPRSDIKGESVWEDWKELIDNVNEEAGGSGSGGVLTTLTDLTASIPYLNLLTGQQQEAVLGEKAFGANGVLDNQLIGFTQFLTMAKSINNSAGDVSDGIIDELGWNTNRKTKTRRFVERLQELHYEYFASSESSQSKVLAAIERAKEVAGENSESAVSIRDFYSNLLGRVGPPSKIGPEQWKEYQDYVSEILESSPEEARLALQISGQINEHIAGLQDKYAGEAARPEQVAYRESLEQMGLGTEEVQKALRNVRAQHNGLAKAANDFSYTHKEFGSKYHTSLREYGNFSKAMTDVLALYGDEILRANPEQTYVMMAGVRDRMFDPDDPEAESNLRILREMGFDIDDPSTQELISAVAPNEEQIEDYRIKIRSLIDTGIQDNKEVPLLPNPETPWQIIIQDLEIERTIDDEERRNLIEDVGPDDLDASIASLEEFVDELDEEESR